jgi:hypothetical protein
VLNAYLDILFNACTKRQYDRVGMMLDGAIYDAEQTVVLDQRLVWIMSELSEHYLSQRRNKEARHLLEMLVVLQKSCTPSETSEDIWFQETALAQILNEPVENHAEGSLFHISKLCNLFASWLKPNAARHASA